MLEVKNITKIFSPGEVSETKVFDDFSLTVNDNDFISVIGSNGSGKTSLLNIICGAVTPDSGDVLLNGKSIRSQREHRRYRYIGRVYQSPAMGTCPDMTILENLALADNKGKPYNFSFGINKKRIAFFREELSTLGLGLEDKLHVRVGSLSGGQRQALALVMATLAPLDFLILDEHTAALDPHTAETIMQLTDRVVHDKHLTAIMITHNMRYAVEYGNRLIMLDRGKIILDRAGAEKETTTTEEILRVFNQIGEIN